jgi:catechol 2,3-dioxygenase-like lactoylglutathione lyase family enzyme
VQLRVYETVIYGTDIDAMVGFYEGVLGLRPVEPPDELAAAFRLGDGGMLLVFDPRRASAPGRRVPSHGATGAGHVAFAVGPGELDARRDALLAHDIEIEQEVEWDARGRSLYVRDPAGNSVELVEGDIWPP